MLFRAWVSKMVFSGPACARSVFVGALGRNLVYDGANSRYKYRAQEQASVSSIFLFLAFIEFTAQER